MSNSYDENRRRIFAARLKGLIDKWELANGKKLSQAKIGEAVNYSRETVNGWLSGKHIPEERTIELLCRFFSVPRNYFNPAEDMIFSDEAHHKELAAEAEETAREIGLSPAFLMFIKENPALADMVISHSWIDAVLQSFSPEVPENPDCPYQFISSTGAKIYLPAEVLYMLRVVQRDLIEYAGFMIEKWSKVIAAAHEQEKNAGPMGTGPSGTFAIKSGERIVSARSRFMLELAGRSGLTLDQSFIADAFNRLDKTGQKKLAEAAAHLDHENRKSSK